MSNRFPGKSCVLCKNESAGVGEHVWPSWFIKEFHGEGPFTIEKGGIPYTKSNGTTASSVALQSVHVPMCEECNGRLGRFIEVPAKPVIRKIMPKSGSHVWPKISAAETEALARWFLKVCLLKSHPDAVHDSPHVQKDESIRHREQDELAWLEWLAKVAAPPAGFSVFLARRSVYGGGSLALEGEGLLLELPSVSVGDKDLHYQTWSAGIRGFDVW